jgi:hypothetical protein
MVQSVNEEKPTDEDLHDIQRTRCINCTSPFDPTIPVVFVRTKRGEFAT